MNYEIDRHGDGRLHLDVRTMGRRFGTSARKQPGSDPDTEVCFGPLHARVTLKDLNVEVTLDPDPGQWNDPDWARDRAWEALLSELDQKLFSEVCAAARKLGCKEGKNKAQRDMCRALGLRKGVDG